MSPTFLPRKHSFSTQLLTALGIFCRPMQRKKKKSQTPNPTNTWLARTKRGFGEWVLKVVEMEKPSWKPSPHAQAPFLCSARGKPGGGQRCGVWSFNSRLFER